MLTVKDINVKSFHYTKRSRSEAAQLRADFDRGIRCDFLIDLAKQEGYLRRLGFSDVDITRMKNGRLPKGYQAIEIIQAIDHYVS